MYGRIIHSDYAGRFVFILGIISDNPKFDFFGALKISRVKKYTSSEFI